MAIRVIGVSRKRLLENESTSLFTSSQIRSMNISQDCQLLLLLSFFGFDVVVSTMLSLPVSCIALIYGGLALGFLGFLPWTATHASSPSVGSNDSHNARPVDASPFPELVRISFQDLQDAFGKETSNGGDLLDAPSPSLIQSIGRAFGPHGLGIVEVTDIPEEMVQLRQQLLPYARLLAHLPPNQLREIEVPELYYSIGWSHGREQLSNGEYDLSKGSFYFDPFRSSKTVIPASGDDDNGCDIANSNVYPPSLQPDLEAMLLRMTHFMASVGEWVLNLCDFYLLQQQEAGLETESNRLLLHQRSLIDTLGMNINAKARLLHYFPTSTGESTSNAGDWCGWHTDHGSLTVLLPGMVTNEETGLEECPAVSNEDEYAAPTDEEYEFKPGLYIRPRQPSASASSATMSANDADNLVHVQLAPSSLGFQIGETISIMSHGQLQATPHAVLSGRRRRPIQGIENEANDKVGAAEQHENPPKVLSRQSLALFLQPNPDEPLPPLAVETDQDQTNSDGLDPQSLAARWRPTFGEFHHATMKAYN